MARLQQSHRQNTEDCRMALNEEAVERTPSSIIHLVNQSFYVNFPIWSQWQAVSVKELDGII